MQKYRMNTLNDNSLTFWHRIVLAMLLVGVSSFVQSLPLLAEAEQVQIKTRAILTGDYTHLAPDHIKKLKSASAKTDKAVIRFKKSNSSKRQQKRMAAILNKQKQLLVKTEVLITRHQFYFDYALKQIELLDQFNSKRYARSYKQAKSHLNKLFTRAEAYESIDELADRRDKINAKLNQLESNMLIDIMVDSKKTASKKLAKELIANQYAILMQSIEALRIQLVENPKDIPVIATLKQRMDFEFEKALVYESEVKRLKQAKNSELETIIDGYHRQLSKIAKSKGLAANENLSFEQRVTHLTK